MEYPLQLSFKLIALSPQVSVTDASGGLVFYVKQKAFKLKESVSVFADAQRTRPVATISADRMLDISGTYRFADPQGRVFGAVRRKGLRSIWKAHYEMIDTDDRLVGSIREDNAWVKFFDGVLSQIPVLAAFSGLLFHPSYTVTRADGSVLLRMKKLPAFFEGRFRIDKVGEPATVEEGNAVLSLLMMLLLERRRG